LWSVGDVEAFSTELKAEPLIDGPSSILTHTSAFDTPVVLQVGCAYTPGHHA